MLSAAIFTASLTPSFINLNSSTEVAQATSKVNGKGLAVPRAYYTTLKEWPTNLLPLMFYNAKEEQSKYRYVVKKDTIACISEYDYTPIENGGVKEKLTYYDEIKLKEKDQMKFELQCFLPINGEIYTQVYISDGIITTKGNKQWVSIYIKASDLKIQI